MEQTQLTISDRLMQAKDSIRGLVPFLGLIVVCIFFQIATGGSLISAANFKTFSNYAFQMMIPACGSVFLMSEGNLDFSMAGNICVSAVLGAMVSHVNPWLGVLMALLCGTCLGLLNGSIHVFFGVSAFIATLATSFVYEGLASVLLGGGAITANFALKQADTLLVKYGIIAVALIITAVVLTKTPFGKQCCAIGANQEVAHQSGVNIKKKKLIPFLIAGFSCGLMAVFVLFRTCSASTSTGSSTHINAMLALLLGGAPFSGGWNTKFRCVVIGSLMMAVVSDGLVLMNATVPAQQIIKGTLFIIAVALSFDRKNTAVIK